MVIILDEANIFDYRFSNTMLKNKCAKMAKNDSAAQLIFMYQNLNLSVPGRIFNFIV
jgi:hypothetical protein